MAASSDQLATQMSLLGLEKYLPSTKNKKASFLSLPPELRLIIYSHATSHHLGSSLVHSSHGRLQFRLAWPLSPIDYRSAAQLAVDSLAQTSRLVRAELLPMIMRGFIVKFPAWTPEFKASCHSWVGEVSEWFCKSVDWIWLEGLYWRVSCRFMGKDVKGEVRSGMEWEDGRARGVDMHMHESSETFEREEFVLRVDYQKSAEESALSCARMTVEFIEKLLVDAGSDGRLGRKQMQALVAQTPLTGTEQHKEQDDQRLFDV